MNNDPMTLEQNTEREILSNMIPRLQNVEDDIKEQKNRQDRLDVRQSNLETAINDLRRDLTETENRLAQRVDARFDSVDAHLASQDERLDKVIGEKKVWPQSAVVAISVLGGAFATALIQTIARSLHWY